jgi:putative cell wall-binding protein
MKMRKISVMLTNVLISPNVENELTYLGIKVERLAGSDRYETAVKVATILTPKDSLHKSVENFLCEKAGQWKVYVIGNTDVISNNVYNRFLNAERIMASFETRKTLG